MAAIPNSNTPYFPEQLRVTLPMAVPTGFSDAALEAWAPVLLGQASWLEQVPDSALDMLEGGDRVFVGAMLALARYFLELGRFPVYDVPRIAGVEPPAPGQRGCTLQLRVARIDFAPGAAYQLAFQTALRLGQWMADHPPTPTHRARAFAWVEKEAIQPLLRLGSAGKSTIPTLRVAHALGIPFLHLGMGVYQLGWGSKARRLDRSSTEIDSAIGARLAQNKVATANLLRAAGLPAPVHQVVAEPNDALVAAGRLGFPVVVKPMDRDRGEGVSVDITDAGMLEAAFMQAQALSKMKQVIVEKQVEGVCHRLFVADGRLLYAVKRWPMSVRGDGRRSVDELVRDELEAQALQPPWERSEIQPIDERAHAALARAGLTPEAIPPAGKLAPLRRIESTADGGVDEEVTKTLHPDNLSAALAAARLFGLHVAGIDIISPDITRPWHENGAIINEVNYAPLLGGAAISRSHIPALLSGLMNGDGRIPIDIASNREDALAAQLAHQEQGRRCFVTDGVSTLDPEGRPVIMPLDGVNRRVRALLLRRDVDAVVIIDPPQQGTHEHRTG